MTQNLPSPVPALLPETAPFSPEQRAWLNGFFAGYLGLDTNGLTVLSPAQSAALLSGIAPFAQASLCNPPSKPGKSSLPDGVARPVVTAQARDQKRLVSG